MVRKAIEKKEGKPSIEVVDAKTWQFLENFRQRGVEEYRYKYSSIK